MENLLFSKVDFKLLHLKGVILEKKIASNSAKSYIQNTDIKMPVNIKVQSPNNYKKNMNK